MPKNKENHALLQYTAAFTASITAIGFVCGYSWPSPALPYLLSKSSIIPITKNQSAWIASLYPLGLIIGYLLNPLFVDRIGRKRTLLLFSLPQVASWLLIIFAKNTLNLYIARVIGGIGYGAGISSSTVYISEIGNVKNRGIFLVLLKCMMNLGFLFTMILGAFLNYQNMNLVLLTMPIIFVLAFSFLPDSSYFRDINRRKEEQEKRDNATVKLKLLREEEENIDRIKFDTFIVKTKVDHIRKEDNEGNVVANANGDNLSSTGQNREQTTGGTFELRGVKTEIETTKGTFEPREVKNADGTFEPRGVTTTEDTFEPRDVKTVKQTTKSTFETKVVKTEKQAKKSTLRNNIFCKLYSEQNYRRALEIMLTMGLTNILSGHAGITTFTQQIFTYEGAFLAPEKASVALALITLIISLLSTIIVERIRRKFLIASTGVIATIALLFVGVFFYCQESKMNVDVFKWVPLVGITTYDVMLSCGMGNVFYVYQGELFAHEVKSESIAFNKISYMTLSFLFLLQFQNFIDAVGTYWAFFSFAFGIFFGTFSVYILTPETKGVNLDDIQVLLKSKKFFY
ncbi:facilitated trehalose transporter Tret1-like [Leptopilina heterotoma]|uniref:facilitated trehalose transporter Tret1-like n=1 Tax=Leptopilina heterotoma TaxID=63436 RepID=UPI001CA8133F|nr:facilitated trehalose transporter Tret1-like [Leptopilina heterotoma]